MTIQQSQLLPYNMVGSPIDMQHQSNFLSDPYNNIVQQKILLQQSFQKHMHKKKYIDLGWILDIQNYTQSFGRWYTLRQKYIQETEENKQYLFDKYLDIIKPIIYKFDQIISKGNQQQYGFYTNVLNQKEIFKIKNIFQPLQKFQIALTVPDNIVTYSEFENLITNQYKDPTKIDQSQPPSNNQLKWWKHGVFVPPATISGVVITGKGEGRKLGMPTANIQVTEQQQKKLFDYPNGVYLVDFSFVKGGSYRGAGCLGTNPQYKNILEKRILEVYVLHDFGKHFFYGANVDVVLKKLTRFQGKYQTFGIFLQAMHNDIHVIRSSCQELYGEMLH